MKKILFATKQLAIYLLTASILFTACKKDKDGTPGYKSGNLVFKTVFPEEGGGGTMVTISGDGFGDIRTIVFDKGDVPATFNPTLNSPGNIIFRVPNDVNGGPQNIVLTNGAGKTVSVPFNALAFPVVDDAFPTDFSAGSTVTLTGNNLDDVTKVLLQGTTNEATIVSATKKQLVLTMPASTISRAKLSVTNVTGELITSQEFLNVDVAKHVFLEDFIDPAQSWSWGGSYAPSTDFKVMGDKSLKATYDKDGGLQIGMWQDLVLPAGTKYLSFWVKGEETERTVNLSINGNGWSGEKTKSLSIPAKKWTNIKEDLTVFYPGLNSVSVIKLQIQGPTGGVMYYDNMMFVK